jgi:hypothetical protein
MSAQTKANFTTPVGRLVQGSLYNPQTTDAEGKPLVVKSGPNAGQPRKDYFFAIAIPKGAEQHWAQTEWGAKIWSVGHTAFPNGQAQAPSFAWKVIDGDSQLPNRNGKKPCDREGYRGHWILNMSSGFAPKIYSADGSQQIVQPDAVKLGYFIQANVTVDGNGSMQQPGIFINHNMVALSAYGPEIVIGPDPTQAGFGGGALPAGASLTPPAGAFNPAPAAAPAPLIPGVPGAQAVPGVYPSAPASASPGIAMSAPAPITFPMPGSVPPPLPVGSAPVPGVPAPTAIAPPPLPVTPNPQFAQVPSVPVPVPALPQRVMLPPANGATYEQLVAGGWNDALLIQHGMMAA